MSTWDDKPNDYEHALAEIERLNAQADHWCNAATANASQLNDVMDENERLRAIVDGDDLGSVRRAYADGYAAAQHEIERLRAECSLERIKTYNARAEERERCARHIELIAADWREAGATEKVWASEYLAREIRDLQ